MENKNHSTEREMRTFSVRLKLEEGNTAHGYAALFNTVTNLGWLDEQIEPGAFDEADMTDVRALFNHDPSMLLARTTSGTLKLSVDEKGLRYEFDIPDTSAGRDLKELLARGDISQSSFGFTIDQEDWEQRMGTKPKRKIKKVKRLFDVSPVTFPAYTDTSVALRSLDAMKEIEGKEAPKDTPLRDQAEVFLI